MPGAALTPPPPNVVSRCNDSLSRPLTHQRPASVSSDFYATSIVPLAPIIIKICRAYTNTQGDFEDYYQKVCADLADQMVAEMEELRS
jgi:hypothetical protein